MAIDPSISLAVRPPVIPPLQIQTPLEKFAKIQTLRNLMGQGQLRELQMQEAQLGLQQTQKGIQQEESLGALFRRNLKPTPEEVYAISPKLGAAYVKSQAEQAKADLETRKTQNEILVQNAKRRAQIAAGVTNLEDAKKAVWQAGNEQLYDLDPTKNAQIARDTLEHLQTQGFIPEEWKQHAMESLDFAARQELADKQAEEKRKQEKAPFDLRTATAGATKAEQEAAGTQPITRYQQAQLDLSTYGKTTPYPLPVQAQKVEEAGATAGARANVLQTPEKIAQDLDIKKRELEIQNQTNINKAMSGDASKVYSIATNLQPGLEQLRAAFKKDYKGTVRGILSGTNPTLAKLASNVSDQVGRLRSGGAVNPSEEKRFKDQIASPSDLVFGNLDATLEALDRYISEAKSVADNLKPSGGGTKTPTGGGGSSKVKVWNEKTNRFEETLTMPKEFVVGDTSYHFPDNYTDEQVQTILTKQGIIKPPTPQRSLGDEALDFGKGALKEIGSTIVHGGDIIRRMTGMERVIDKPEVQALITPQGTAQKAGYGAAQIGEFLVPSGLIGKGTKVIEGATAGLRAAKALNLAGRVGLEAASAAGVTGLQTGGDPEAMKQAALTAGVTTGVLGAATEGLTKLAPALKESAIAQYNRVLNPTKQGTKFLAKTEVAPGLLERQVAAASLKTLQGKAAAQVQKWGQTIEDAYTNLPAGSAADLNSVTQRLDTMGEEFTILNTSTGELVPMGPQAKTALKNIDRLKQSLTDIAQPNPQTGALEVPVDRVRKLRQYFDGIAAKAGRYEGKTLADQSAAEAHGLAADAIREELAQQFPDIAKINKEFSFWKDAQKVVDETVLRRTGQAKPLGRKLMGAAGTAGGFATGGIAGAIVGRKVMDTLEQLTTSTAWGTVSAVNKDRLADALAKGSGAEVEFWVRRIANSISGARATQSSLTPAEAR